MVFFKSAYSLFADSGSPTAPAWDELSMLNGRDPFQMVSGMEPPQPCYPASASPSSSGLICLSSWDSYGTSDKEYHFGRVCFEFGEPCRPTNRAMRLYTPAAGIKASENKMHKTVYAYSPVLRSPPQTHVSFCVCLVHILGHFSPESDCIGLRAAAGRLYFDQPGRNFPGPS